MISHNSREIKIQKIHEAIAKTVALNPNPEHIRKRLFQLVREVKTIVGFDKSIDDSYKKIAQKWFVKSKPHLNDDPFDIIWAQFMTGWNKVKYSTDSQIFLKLSCIAYSCEYPPICSERGEVLKDLIRLCAVLDSYWSPEPFYLSCRMAEDEFGYSHAKMAALLEMLVLDGVLELVKKGSMGRASRYKFLADKGTIDLSSMDTIGEISRKVL
jgi:hypothetical protein